MTSPDSDLIAEALRGEREAFDRLLHRHRRAVVSYLGACGCRRSDVEDLCQEAYVRAFLTLSECDPSQPFVGWLLGIARNVFRHHRRRTRTMLQAIQRIGLQVVARAETSTATASEDFAERRSAALRSAIERLGSPLRSVLFLRYDQQMSLEEMARVEGISVGSVKMRLLRARRILKQRLADWDLSASRSKDR